jgi:(2Fe-2S) ferredoxin
MTGTGSDGAEKPSQTLEARCAKIGIPSARRHIFLCTGPKCVSEAEGMATWDWLKKRVVEDDVKGLGVLRTKVGCLRVCQQGPIALVYPEGTWYRNADQKGCSQIVESHIKRGVPVEELCFVTNALSED